MRGTGKKIVRTACCLLIACAVGTSGAESVSTSASARHVEGITQTEKKSLIKEVKTSKPRIDTSHIAEFARPEWIPMIEQICAWYDISPELVEAMIERESGGNENASSGYGDEGSMQVVVSIHRERMADLGVWNIYDPYGGIMVGVDVLNAFREQYGDDLYLVLGKYNGQSDCAAGVPNDYAEWVLSRAAELTLKHDNE